MSTDSTRPTIIAVVGPTAAGKTALAESLAMELGGEIVSADSMQVYRGMDIGTAKSPTPWRVPYHCVNIVDPGTPYSAALFQRDARAAFEGIWAGNRRPIVAGGTGLYVRSALDDWEIPTGHLESESRERLEADLAELGAEAMHERLASVDPAAAELIHPNNARRVLRALEMAENGASYVEQAEQFATRRSYYDDTAFIGVTRERSQLYERIDRRVDEMLDAGLLDEVARLLDEGFRDALTAAQAIGYKEFVPVVESGADVSAAADAVKQATRRYAKRQLTWFGADPRITWLDATGALPEDLTAAALDLVDSD